MEELREAILGDLKKVFRPEFLNRLDDVIVFRQLTRPEIRDIARRMLDTVGQRLEKLGVALRTGEEALDLLARDGFDPAYGARPLRRTIRARPAGGCPGGKGGPHRPASGVRSPRHPARAVHTNEKGGTPRMRRTLSLTLSALLLALALAGCADGKPAESHKAAIEGARSEEDNEYNTILTSSDDDMAELIFGLLNVSEEDMTAYAISVSAMNVRAYGVAAILPAAGKEDLVLEGLNSFVENQKRSFEQYLADQYEIAKEAKVGTLEDGTVLLVMCENQDAVYDSIKDALS